MSDLTAAAARILLEWDKVRVSYQVTLVEPDSVKLARHVLAEREDDGEWLNELLAIYKEADAERLQETEAARMEAQKWEMEHDMYGWNFHEGRAAGITWGSIYFNRVRRWIEDKMKALGVTLKEPQ